MVAVLDITSLTAAVLLLSLAAATCLSTNNLGRRLIALFIAMVGAVLAASGLHADSGALIAGIAVAAAYAAIGFSLLVRLQETYQSVETDEVDAHDLSDEPPEPRA
jgi:NADH:ubiquinone oxidoreductase subunit K